MLLFKIDENLPKELAEMLNANGHNTLSVYDQNFEGEPDDVVSKVCQAKTGQLSHSTLAFQM